MSFDPQQIKIGASQEVFRAIKARFSKGDSITMAEVITEAAYCLAANNKILKNKMPPGTFNEEIMEYFFDGVFSKIEETFPRQWKPDLKQNILIEYEEILQSPLCDLQINGHYNDLFGSSGGNVS
jgi:hypothetical protein